MSTNQKPQNSPFFFHILFTKPNKTLKEGLKGQLAKQAIA
jgi:hypothetical protein